MDRGYTRLLNMYYSSEHNDKYLIRLQNKDFKKQIDNMKGNDEIKYKMFDLLEQKIEKYLVPIKKDRHYPRNHYHKKNIQ